LRVVAARGDHDGALAVRVPNGLLETGRFVTTETQVDDAGTVVGGPDDALGDVRRDTGAVRVEDPYAKDATPGAAPSIPTPLLIRAAITAATCVP
jgi:hypothetical protein